MYNKKAEYFISEYEKNPDYIKVLSLIMEENNPRIKVISFICFQNYSKNLFSKNYLKITNDKNVLKGLKILVKNTLFNFLITQKDYKLRRILNSMLCIIVLEGDIFIQDFYQYAFNIVNKIKAEKVLNDFTSKELQTVVKVFVEICKRKNLVGGDVYCNFQSKFAPVVFELWEYLTQNFYNFENVPNLDLREILFQFNFLIDKLVIYIYIGSKNLANMKDFLSLKLEHLIEKNEKIFLITKKVEKIESSEIFSENMLNYLSKNTLVFSFHFKQIFQNNPLIFSDILQNYLNFLLSYYVQKWENQTIEKSLSLLLMQILKTFLYYTSPEELQQKDLYNKLNINKPLQTRCYEIFNNIFDNVQTLQNLVQIIVSEKMLYDLDEINFETFLEDQEDKGLDTVLSELECSLPKLNSLIMRQLFFKFPKSTLPIYKELLEMILEEKINLSDDIQDNVFSLLIYFPKIYQELNIPSNFLDQKKIVEYLFSKGYNKIVFTRRFLIIFQHFEMFRDESNKQDYCEMILKFFTIEDDIVQFESLECLSNLIKFDDNNSLNYVYLLQITTPLFLKFLQKFNNPSLVFKLGSYLSNVLEKAGDNLNENNILIFKNFDIEVLISRDTKLMAPVLMDILSSLIFVFSDKQSDFIIGMCIKFIKIYISIYDPDNLAAFLKFLLVVLKNTYDLQKNKETISCLISLFYENLSRFSKQLEEPDIIINIINIMEEILLIGEQTEIYLIQNFIKDSYQKAQELDSKDSLFIRSNTLGIYCTYLLLTLNQNKFEIQNFEFCIKAALTEICSNFSDDKNSLFVQLSTQALSLFNRFLIYNPKEIISFIMTCNLISYFDR